jgi:hypothetical protein
MTASNPTPVITNICWEIVAETNLNDCIEKSSPTGLDPNETVKVYLLSDRYAYSGRT